MKPSTFYFLISRFYFLFSIFLTVFLLSTFCFLFSITPVFAAEFFFEPISQEVNIGEQFQVDLILDTENKNINAFEGRVIFPGALLELKEIRDGNTIVNFWITNPQMATNQGANGNEIRFSGITPGGFSGERGLIFSVIFQTKSEGEGTIKIREAKTLLNDGLGTLASLSISNFQFVTIREPIRDDLWVSPKDTDLPELFTPKIASDPNIFDGKWFVVFATQDKGSGIAYYAIHESRRMKRRIATNEWIEAESPYLLKDQELRSFIYVKAVDKAGNERIAVVEPRYPMRWYEMWWIWVMIIVIVILCILWKLKAEHRRLQAERRRKI